MVNQRFKIGQKVKVKSFVEICKTLDENGWHKETRLGFDADMVKFCQNTYTISPLSLDESEITLAGLVYNGGIPWYFHKDWLEPAERVVQW